MVLLFDDRCESWESLRAAPISGTDSTIAWTSQRRANRHKLKLRLIAIAGFGAQVARRRQSARPRRPQTENVAASVAMQGTVRSCRSMGWPLVPVHALAIEPASRPGAAVPAIAGSIPAEGMPGGRQINRA
jgi:hypothetical protein